MKWLNEGLSAIGLAIGIDISLTKEVLGIILIVANIVILIVSTTLKMIDWFKKSKADGKITSEEIKEGLEIIKDGTEKITETIEKNKEESK